MITTLLDRTDQDPSALSIINSTYSGLDRYLLDDNWYRLTVDGVFLPQRLMRDMILHFVNTEEYERCAYLRDRMKRYVGR